MIFKCKQAENLATNILKIRVIHFSLFDNFQSLEAYISCRGSVIGAVKELYDTFIVFKFNVNLYDLDQNAVISVANEQRKATLWYIYIN